MRRSRLPPGILALCLALLSPGEAGAGGPLLIGRDGTPRRWSTQTPVVLSLDRGGLGGISNPGALLQHAVSQWNGVENSALRVQIGDPLGTDVENLTEAQLNALITRDDGTNPVILDSTGAIFEKIYGPDSGVVGVAGPSLVATSSGVIVKGFAMFNGEGASEASAEIMKAAVTHEIGHLLNLEHAQINGARIGSQVPGFTGTVPASSVETMFPILVQSGLRPHPMASLHRDDRAAFAALYPAPNFGPTTASMTGKVFDVDGDTLIQGVNVIARNVENPFDDAVSFVSGLLAPEGVSSSAAHGAFDLRGLTAGATYKVYIEEVASFFVEGARVGPLDPPLDLDATDPAAFLEFWSGAEESENNPPDNPLEGASLKITAGVTASDVDFIWNGVKPRAESVEPSSGTYERPQRIAVTGANFIGTRSVVLDAERPVSLTSITVVDSSSLEATVPAGALPGLYRVVVTNTRGSNDPGSVEYTVTEPPPIVQSTIPDALENDRPRTLSITGSHLLGARAVRLARAGVPDTALEILGIVSSGRLTVQVPAGVLPGAYSVVVTNTAGESSGGSLLQILELAPLLEGATDPPAARNGASKEVRITGNNLAGTTSVELVNGTGSIPLVIVSTSLDEVVVMVPGGLEPGTYTVRITNSAGTVTGPAVFEVKKARSGGGGGGGCAASQAGPASPVDILPLLVLLGAALLARRRRSRDRLRIAGAGS